MLTGAELGAASPAGSSSAELGSEVSGEVFHHMDAARVPPAAEGKGQLLPARPRHHPLLWSPCWAPRSVLKLSPT